MQMQGPYIKNRLFPKLVSQACQERGASVTAFSDDWILMIEKNRKKYWAVGYSFDLNATGASTVARDKVACYQVLRHEGVPAIEHYLLRSRGQHKLLVENIPSALTNAPVVIKPLLGTGGVGVQKFGTAQLASEFVADDPHPDWALSPYHEIVSEVRLIICDQKILCAYEKIEPYEKDGLRYFNLGLGAKARDINPTDEYVTLAYAAMSAIGLRVASVDIARQADDSLIVMEVNDGITMERYARQSSENLLTTTQVYENIVSKLLDNHA